MRSCPSLLFTHHKSLNQVLTMKLSISAVTVAIGLAFSTGAMAEDISAEGMTKNAYKAEVKQIEARYELAKDACDGLDGNAKDICQAEAKGEEKVAKAELEAAYKPTPKNHYEARIARAEADHSVARERCDDMSGNAKDVCQQEAKAAETAARADAKAQMKSAEASIEAGESSAEARNEAVEESADARDEAAAETRDAEYAVAKERCDAFAGDLKDRCITDAKAQYGKS